MAFNEGLVPLPDGAKLFVRAVGQEKEEQASLLFPVAVPTLFFFCPYALAVGHHLKIRTPEGATVLS